MERITSPMISLAFLLFLSISVTSTWQSGGGGAVVATPLEGEEAFDGECSCGESGRDAPSTSGKAGAKSLSVSPVCVASDDDARTSAPAVGYVH